jgi:peptidyl-prolyl cis-trans isomerase C
MFSFSAPTRESVLDDMIKRELAIQEAKRLGLENDPEVQERMQNVLYQALLEKQLAKEFESINITDEAAKEYYEKYPEIRSSHIFIGLRPDAPKAEVDAAYARMKTIQDVHLKDPSKGFAEVAQRFSEGVAAPMGGDIDYQTKDRPDPTYYSTALALKTPGKISGVVRTQHGLHIIKLTAVRPWANVDRAKIKRLVFDEKRQQVFEKYMADLRKKSKVTIHSDILGTVR